MLLYETLTKFVFEPSMTEKERWIWHVEFFTKIETLVELSDLILKSFAVSFRVEACFKVFIYYMPFTYVIIQAMFKRVA